MESFRQLNERGFWSSKNPQRVGENDGQNR